VKRRKFIKGTVVAGMAGGLALNLRGATSALINKTFDSSSGKKYDLVGIKGGSPAAMFDRGIEALGGMGNFDKKGQTVVVKPNIGWSQTPETAANSNPDLIKRIIEQCFESGAKEVYMFDHTCNFRIDAEGLKMDLEEFELELIDFDVEEVFEDEDGILIYAPFEQFGAIQKYLEEIKLEILSSGFERIPTTTKNLSEEEQADVEKLLERLEEEDDVQNVYHSMELN
jgi:hypothetical protein